MTHAAPPVTFEYIQFRPQVVEYVQHPPDDLRRATSDLLVHSAPSASRPMTYAAPPLTFGYIQLCPQVVEYFKSPPDDLRHATSDL